MIDATKSRKSNVAAIGAVIALAAGAFAGVMMWPHTAPVQTATAPIRVAVQVAKPAPRMISITTESETDAADLKAINAENARQAAFARDAANLPPALKTADSDAARVADVAWTTEQAGIILKGQLAQDAERERDHAALTAATRANAKNIATLENLTEK